MSGASHPRQLDFEIRGARSLDVAGLAQTHLAAWLHAYHGVVDDGWLSSLTAQEFEKYHRPRLSDAGSEPAEPFLVAVAPEAAARRPDESIGSHTRSRSAAPAPSTLGFALAGPTRAKSPTGDSLPDDFAGAFSAELYAIYVHPSCQGRGIGRALVGRIVEELVVRSHPSMCLWVLSGNTQARRFYERAGGLLVAESAITLGGRGYPQVAYGWDRLHDLKESPS